MRRICLGLVLIGLNFPPLLADNPPRQQAVLERDYHGDHADEFATDFDRIRLLVRQAQVEVSSELGLIQYQEGFRYPVTVRFQDGAPPGVEHALAFVRLYGSADGFRQELVINLAMMSKYSLDFDKIFYHEMTHVVLNDAVDGDAVTLIPHWVQEGLAVYISGDGNAMISDITKRLRKSQAGYFLSDLDEPFTSRSYPQAYLTIKYILQAGSINALQGFVRDLMAGKTTQSSLNDMLSLDWTTFKAKARAFSLAYLEQRAVPDGQFVF